MLCAKPFIKGDITFPCGQCLPCRLNRRRLWTHRIVLESLKHDNNSFITLTYDNEHLPPDASVIPRHLQLFFKRLREEVRPARIRYYAVGEYGDVSQRPHYHAAVFGLGLDAAPVIQSCWPDGFTYTGSLTLESAQYISGYVTKKMTKTDDPRLNGRHPEFARMSNRPGIGAGALDELEAFYRSELGGKLLASAADVPHALRHGGKVLPLGRYLRGKLRERLQIESKGTADPYFQQNLEEMSALFEASEARTRWQKLEAYNKSTKQKIRNLNSRHNIQKSKGKIL